MRGTTNGNARGSKEDRRRRRKWLFDTLGDGACVRCYRCSAVLTFDTLTVDRITPGCQGGTYVRTNIRPACGPCNSETGGSVRRVVMTLPDGRQVTVEDPQERQKAALPAPEVLARPARPEETPRGAQAVHRRALAAQWTAGVTYSRGPWLNLGGAQPKIVDCIVVWMRRHGEQVWARWVGNGGTYKFDCGYAFGRRLSYEDLKEVLK